MAAGRQRFSIISDGLPTQLPDIDPEETRDWVDSFDSVVRTLTSRGLIAETETDPDTGGGLYCTTDLFLEKMGLRSLAELPSLAPMLPDVDTLDTDAL